MVPLVSWQAGSVPDDTVIAVGVPTVAVTVIVAVPDMTFEHVGAV